MDDLNSLKRYNIVLNFKPFPFNHVHFYVSHIAGPRSAIGRAPDS